MPPNVHQFLSANASAVFGLIGALGGGVLSFLATLILKKRDFNLQMWGKLFDRRIAAHEKVISLAVEMRVMVGLGGRDKHGEVRRAPQVLLSKEEFERWFTRFTELTMEGTTWLSIATKRLPERLETLPVSQLSLGLFHVEGDIEYQYASQVAKCSTGKFWLSNHLAYTRQQFPG